MITFKYKMVGRFKIEKFKGRELPDGSVREEPGTRKLCADWFDNLLLDPGLNEIGTLGIASAKNYCQVGSGNATPTVTDSSLGNHIAGTSNTQSTNDVFQTAVAPYYLAQQQVKRFAQGAAAGVLAEVGMGWAATGTTLFSRALIEDSAGNPTTITVLSDEFLDVTYELRLYPDTDDSVGTVTIGGITYDYTARPSEIDSGTLWTWTPWGTAANMATARVYSGSIGDVFSSPGGSFSTASAAQNGSYSNNSLQGDCGYSWGLNNGNVGGVRSARLKVGWSNWQIEFSAQGTGDPIPKDNTTVLDLTIAHSWARGSI